MMVKMQRPLNIHFNRDLIEAISLSLAFHIAFAFLVLIGHPSLLRHGSDSDLYFRFEERTPLFYHGATSPLDPPAQPAPRAGEMKVFWENWDRPEKGELNKNISADGQIDPAWEAGGNAGIDPREVMSGTSGEGSLADWSQKLFDQFDQSAQILTDRQEQRAGDQIALLKKSKGDELLAPPPAESICRDGALRPLDLSNFGALTKRGERRLALDGFSPIGTHWERAKAAPLSKAEDLANSENLLIETKIYRRLAGPGLLLEATYRPKEDASFCKLHQNILFLIDRSSSISARRFAHYKAAVISALDHLQGDESFNILFFDKRSVRFSQKAQLATKENLEAAKAFVKREKLGSFFTSSDLCSSLDQLALDQAEDDAVSSALLLTTGETRQSRERQRRSIAHFCAKNDGKSALFIFAQGAKNNLPLLELLAHFNKGRLHHAEDEQKFSHALKASVISLRFPIGKEMLASAIGEKSGALQLLPRSGQQGDLYPQFAHRVMGIWTGSSDVYLYLQGRHKGDWLDIKHKVRIDHIIEKSDKEVEARYLVLQAFEHYGNYLKSGDFAELKRAQDLLSTLGYPLAFT